MKTFLHNEASRSFDTGVRKQLSYTRKDFTEYYL